MVTNVLILPGLNGTDRLLQRFLRRAPPALACAVVCYPEELAALDEFVDAIARRLDTRLILLAESFSGPIAAAVAAKFPAQIAGIIFAASFVEPPHPYLLRLVRATPAFAFGAMREFLVNHICLNGCDDAHTVNDAHQVIGGLQSSCIKRRLQVLAGVKGQPKSLRALPVLSLGATRDRLLTHAATTSIKRAFPNAQSVWIDAPHFILQTRADECWAHIARFVATGPG